MAYIWLVKDNMAIKSVRCKRNFLHWYDLDFSSTSLFSVHPNPTVNQFIKWIEDQIKWDDKRGYVYTHKYQTEPIEFAKTTLLPMAKTWDKKLRIVVYDSFR